MFGVIHREIAILTYHGSKDSLLLVSVKISATGTPQFLPGFWLLAEIWAKQSERI